MSDLLRRNFPDYAADKEIVPAATEDNDYPLMVREDRILRLPRDVLLRPGETDRITLNGVECALGGRYTVGLQIVGSNAEMQSLSTNDYSTVIRVGHSSRGDSPPLVYHAGVGPSALNGGDGDGFSEVPSADGNHWRASFPDGHINVLWVPGVDPTGTTACEAAFNAAATVIRNGKRLNIFVPPGTYRLNDTVHIANGQGLIGANGRTQTTFLIDDQLNPAAVSVVYLTGAEQNAPFVQDINFSFAQPSDQTLRANYKTLADGGTSGTGGTGVKYPPAIGGTGNARAKIERVRVAGAWDGFSLAGNSGGAWYKDIEMGALNIGLKADGPLDFVHIHGWHNWPFGMVGSGALTVWQDGQTIAWDIGALSGLKAVDVSVYRSKINIAGAFGNITDLGLDLNGSSLNVSVGGFLTVTGLYSSRGDGDSSAVVNVTGGRVSLINSTIFQADTSPGVPFRVSGGNLLVDGGTIIRPTSITNIPIAEQLGASDFAIRNMRIDPGTFNDSTTPVIKSTPASGVRIAVTGNQFTYGGGAGSGPAVSIAQDDRSNLVANNNFHLFNFIPPGGLGEYGPNRVPLQTATGITASFETPGTFSPSYISAPLSRWKMVGAGLMWFKTQVFFNAGTYSGASGAFEIDPKLPFQPVGTAEAITLERISRVTYPVGALLLPELQPNGKIRIRASQSGTNEVDLGPSAIPSGEINVLFTITGFVRTSPE